MDLIEAVNGEVVNAIDLLCKKIHQQGFTESEVTEALNWKATYFEDLRSESPKFSFDDLLLVLKAIGIEPRSFFTELYGESKPNDSPAELTSLSGTVDRIAELLIQNGHFTAGDLARASAAHANRDPRRKAKAPARSPEPIDEPKVER